MQQKIIQVGNSAAVIIPKTLLIEVGLNIGSKVTLEKDPNGPAIAISKNGSNFKSSITPEFVSIVERVNKQYGPALRALAQRRS